MTGPDDASLVRAAQAGDSASLGLLLDRHRALLQAVAVGMLGHGPRAEDAVHDAFLIALRRIKDVREPTAARAWLLAILGNVCRAELRRPAAEPVAELAASSAGAPAVEEAIERLALRDWVWTALERLSAPLRLVVLLRHFTSATSYEAIADICGVPVGTVRSRLHAARTKLAEALLDTAAAAHRDADALREVALEHGAAMAAFERSGDRGPLSDILAPDLRFVLADRVERRGRDLYAALLESDFADGVSSRVARVIPGAELAVVELWLENPRDQPLHCPPAVTQVHFHDGHTTHRIATHYADRP
jgi:RNA polymerase sigma factor (sigma-70 family)